MEWVNRPRISFLMTHPTPARRGALGDGFTTFADRALAFPPPTLDFAGVREVADTLGINYQLASQVMVSEWALHYLPGREAEQWCHVRDQSLFVPREGLEVLAGVPCADEDVDYLNVRVGPGTRDDNPTWNGRTYMGAHGRYTPEEQYLAATRYWPVASPDEWVGKLFVASLGSFVTLCGRITDVAWHGVRIGFDVDVDDAESVERFRDRRIRVHPGTLVIKRRAGQR